MERVYKKELIVAMCIIIYSFWCERITMYPTVNIGYYIIVKLLFCMAVFMGVYCGRKVDRDKTKYLLIIVTICLIINLTILSLIWPGILGGDELWLLPNVRAFNLSTVQHWMIAIIYIWSLMIIPSPVGIVIVFILINLLAIYFLLDVLYSRISNKKYLYILIVPSCSFEVLLFTEYPLRCSIFGSLEIIAFIWIFQLFFEDIKNGV